MFRHLKDDDAGAVAVIVAILLITFIGMAALVVDMGHWYNVRRQLQSAADAAALAGCQELAQGQANEVIWSTVEEYAGLNVRGPVTSASVIPPTEGGLSDIEDDAVKVTVESDSGSYFGHVLGIDALRIQAQARAKVGFIYGVNGPVPWSISVIRATEMEAVIGGVGVVMSDEDGDGEWTGFAPAGSSGAVSVTIRNRQGYSETFENMVAVASLPASSAISAVQVLDTTFDSGSGSGCPVQVTLREPLPAGYTLKVGRGNALNAMTVANAATNTYEGNVDLPTTSDPFVRVPITVERKKGSDTQTVVFSVLVRRANYILKDVQVTPIAAGPLDVVQISVRPMDFQYGQQYQMKVEGGGGSSGNFLRVDLNSLDHRECGFDAEAAQGGSGGRDYREYIVGVPSLQVHVNDYVQVQTGADVGNTQIGLTDRFRGWDLYAWDEWAPTKPTTPQLVAVPITEKVERITGTSELKIISFATFFIEEKPTGANDPVIGRFVQYVSPGVIVGPNPPYPMADKGVYLTSEGLSF